MIRRASAEPSVFPLTEARARLFRIVEDVLEGRTDRVALSHRGHEENVLLVRERDVARMEEELASLRKRVAPAPRALRGMGRILGSAEDALAEIRADQSALFDAKLRMISSDVTPPKPDSAPGATSSVKRGRGRSRAGQKHNAR